MKSFKLIATLMMGLAVLPNASELATQTPEITKDHLEALGYIEVAKALSKGWHSTAFYMPDVSKTAQEQYLKSLKDRGYKVFIGDTPSQYFIKW